MDIHANYDRRKIFSYNYFTLSIKLMIMKWDNGWQKKLNMLNLNTNFKDHELKNFGFGVFPKGLYIILATKEDVDWITCCIRWFLSLCWQFPLHGKYKWKGINSQNLNFHRSLYVCTQCLWEIMKMVSWEN